MRLLLHAPNVNSGGGLLLLDRLIGESQEKISWAQLDSRVKNSELQLRALSPVFIKNSLPSRILAEWRLSVVSKADDIVLCFHGLPPFFTVRGRVVVFVQNRLLIDGSRLDRFPWRTRLRLLGERFWLRQRKHYATRYVVQTPSMAALLEGFLGSGIDISISSFVPLLQYETGQEQHSQFDFVYVASGDAHKNHLNLFSAWELLFKDGCQPSLALTLDPLIDAKLCSEINRLAHQGLKISNLGKLSHDQVQDLYRCSSALIYPSLSESMGLPLIEAQMFALEIVASERDYVRDVVIPVETFDPCSPVSIARAVRRFLKNSDAVIEIGGAEKFVSDILR